MGLQNAKFRKKNQPGVAKATVRFVKGLRGAAFVDAGWPLLFIKTCRDKPNVLSLSQQRGRKIERSPPLRFVRNWAV